MTESIRDAILEAFDDAIAHTEKELLIEEVTDDVVLLETGLDSLGFAIMVVMLEGKLGYDPFQMMENPIYPRTFGEFVEIYEKNAPL